MGIAIAGIAGFVIGSIVAYVTVTRSIRFALKVRAVVDTEDLDAIMPGEDTAEEEFAAQEVRR